MVEVLLLYLCYQTVGLPIPCLMVEVLQLQGPVVNQSNYHTVNHDQEKMNSCYCQIVLWVTQAIIVMILTPYMWWAMRKRYNDPSETPTSCFE